jgi:transcriptional regulator with XRE-family HTH domain
MKALPSTSTAATVRAYFGLSQAELAQFLGITRALVGHVETGRRELSRAHSKQLDLLADLLPPPEGEGPAEPAAVPPETEPLDALPLRRRQRRCLWKARKLRWELEKLEGQAHRARRWQQLLPRLQALLPADPAATKAPRTRPWLDYHAAEAAAELDPSSTTARVLLALRIEHLESEAARLGQLLAANPAA